MALVLILTIGQAVSSTLAWIGFYSSAPSFAAPKTESRFGRTGG